MIEFRELQSFLAVAEEGTISGAAQALHTAQPSLSRQMKELEKKLGKTLFIRGNRRITLTEEGRLLRKRAGELTRLMEKTEQEITNIDKDISGDLYIGTAETMAVHYLTKTAASLQEDYPDIHFHLSSGDTNDTIYQLEQGLIDFALLFIPSNNEKYNTLRLPVSDRFGVLMRKDHPFADRKTLSFKDDLITEPLIMSRLVKGNLFPGINDFDLNIVATYNLAYVASLMVEDGLGIAICFDSIVDVNNNSKNNLVFVPLEDDGVPVRPVLIWKKYQVLTKAAQIFIDQLQKYI